MLGMMSHFPPSDRPTGPVTVYTIAGGVFLGVLGVVAVVGVVHALALAGQGAARSVCPHAPATPGHLEGMGERTPEVRGGRLTTPPRGAKLSAESPSPSQGCPAARHGG